MLQSIPTLNSTIVLFDNYVDTGGSDLSLVTRLLEYFDDNLIALSYPGIGNIWYFRVVYYQMKTMVK